MIEVYHLQLVLFLNCVIIKDIYHFDWNNSILDII